MDSVGITRKCTKLLSLTEWHGKALKATMIPSFPSKTFPNHYTMATGLVPDHHGIVANSFWDPERKEVYKMNKPATRNDASYYGGEPIWVTAQKQGIKTGNVYWVGSDIAVKEQHPTYYHVYDKKPRLSQTERVAEVLRMLRLPEEERPQLIMLYFEDSDTYGHTYSPFSQETSPMRYPPRCANEFPMGRTTKFAVRQGD